MAEGRDYEDRQAYSMEPMSSVPMAKRFSPENATSLPPLTAPVDSNMPPTFRSLSRQQSHQGRHYRPMPKPMHGSKWDIVRQSVQKSVVDFFGVGEEDEETKEWNKHKWRNRSIMLHRGNRLIGNELKPDALGDNDSVFDSGSAQPSPRVTTAPAGMNFDDTDGPLASSHQSSVLSASFRSKPHIFDPYAKRTQRQDSKSSRHAPSRQVSRISTASSSRRSMRIYPRPRTRKESVFKMAYEGLTSMVAGTKKPHRQITRQISSFSPNIFSDEPAALKSKSPTEESVFMPGEDLLDDVFFDTPTPTNILGTPDLRRRVKLGAPSSGPTSELNTPDSLPTILERASDGGGGDGLDSVDNSRFNFASTEGTPYVTQGSEEEKEVSVRVQAADDKDYLIATKESESGWTIPRKIPMAQPLHEKEKESYDEVDTGFEGLSRMKNVILDKTLDNSNRRELGKGVIGDLLNRQYKEEMINDEIQAQMDDMMDHRPYFTYWVCMVQIVVYIVSVSVYGVAPIGVEETRVEAEVMQPNLAIEKVSYFEKDNLWIGPRQADLIHLGAKYSPCMRKDENVENALEMDRLREKKTACCILNDGSGCVQTSRDECSGTLADWYKWPDEDKVGRSSGSVCGQDPSYCEIPESLAPHEWPDDITKWPICRKGLNSSEKHIQCKVSGRPCCIGIQGECVITTREHCAFVKGYFHEEAALCSQVNCMNEICGMIPFLEPDKPDQFYRLFTAPFLHAGLIQLVISVLFQFFIMRDIERLAGWLRIGIIYVGSGIAGSLSSAIFLPYHVEAGPAGAQFGLLACLVVEVLQNWHILKSPWWSLGKLLIIILVLFVIGLLPFIDNYAHLIGLIFGFLLSFALLPYVTFNIEDKRAKIVGIIICLVVFVGLFALLVILFYVSPVYSCPNCHYFNCIPFTPSFCKGMEVKIGRDKSY